MDGISLRGSGVDSKRTKIGHTKKSRTYLLCITILSMIAGGCFMTPPQTHYMTAGAASDALVGGDIGCGIAVSID